MRKFIYTYRGDPLNSLRSLVDEEEMIKRIKNNGPNSRECAKHFKVFEVKEVEIEAFDKEITQVVVETSYSISS